MLDAPVVTQHIVQRPVTMMGVQYFRGEVVDTSGWVRVRSLVDRRVITPHPQPVEDTVEIEGKTFISQEWAQPYIDWLASIPPAEQDAVLDVVDLTDSTKHSPSKTGAKTKKEGAANAGQ